MHSHMKASGEFNLQHSLELEHQIIGMTLEATRLKRRRVWQEFCQLTPEDFFDPLHQIAWGAILRLHDAGKPVDVVTVLTETMGDQEMKRLLVECASNIVSWEGYEEFSGILKDLAQKRKAVYVCLEGAHRAATEGYTSPAADIAGSIIDNLQTQLAGRRDLIGTDELSDEILEDLDKPVYATPTGFPRLDKVMLGGFHRGRYYGLSANEKAGKTTMMGPSISYNMAMAGRPHVYIGLEMGAKEIYQRYIARWMFEELERRYKAGDRLARSLLFDQETGEQKSFTSSLFYDEYIRGQKWFRDLNEDAKQAFKNSGLKFLPKPRMHLDELKSTLARINLSGEYEGVFIDYMQLVGGCKTENGMVTHLYNVNQTLAESSKNIWIVAAAQENDEGEVRYGKGMKAAVDIMWSLKREEIPAVQSDGNEIPVYKSRLLMKATRYTPTTDIGTENEPAYDFDTTAGPCYRELPKPQVKDFMKGLR